MRTVLALLVAVGMVAGALYLRGRLDRGEELNPLAPSEPPVMVCASEFVDLCVDVGEDVEVIIEDAEVTAERLVAADAEPIDGWLVAAPWPQIVDDARARMGLPDVFGDAGAPVARSPVVLAMWDDRAEALTPNCPNRRLSWDCLGRAAGNPWTDVGGRSTWGLVKPAHDGPEGGSAGVVVLGGVVANYLGRLDFNSRDLDSDAFLGWFTGLEEAVPEFGTGDGQLMSAMLTRGRASYDAVGTVEAFAAPLLERSPQGDDVRLLYPEPVVSVDVVLAQWQGSQQGERLGDMMGAALPAALAASGWRVEGEPVAGGIPSEPALSEPPQAPSAGVLDALRATWSEVTR